MIDPLVYLLLVILGIYVLILFRWKYHPHWWYAPIAITVVTPILFKISPISGIYVHPAAALMGIWGVLYLFWYRGEWFSAVKAYTSDWVSHRYSMSSTLVLFFGVFLIGAIVSLIRWGYIDIGQGLRYLSYSIGFAAYWLCYAAAKRYDAKIVPRVAYGFVGIMAVFALFGLYRVLSFAISGGFIDYYQYGPQYQVLGMLGQYVDSTGLHLIRSGAAENSGWLMNLALFVSLMLAVQAIRSRQWKQVTLYSLLSGIFVIGMLYTLSRSNLLALYLGLGLFSFLTLKSWFQRIVVVLITLLVTVGIILLFPNAPFVSKTANTVQLIQRENPSSHEPNKQMASKSAKPQHGGAPADHGNVSEELELEPSAAGRITYWKQAISVATRSPIDTLIGVGLVDLRSRYNGLVPHSLLLQQFVMFGILGVIAFAGLWIGIVRQLWHIRLSINLKNSSTELILMPLIFIVPGWLISNLIFGANLLSIELLIVFFGLMGLVSSPRAGEERR